VAKRDPRPVGDLVVELFKRRGFTRSLRRAEAVLLWPRVVGADVARFSAARTLNDGVLIVDVSDSETAMHLSLQRRRFLERYRETYGVNDVKEIRFQVGRSPAGGVDDGSRASPATAGDNSEGHEEDHGPELEPRAVADMTRQLESLELPAELAATVRLAGRSLLGMRARQRATGFTACPTCGALHDGLGAPLTPREKTLQAKHPEHQALAERELCSSCRRYLREPRVKDAARRLALALGNPEEGISEAELAVAKRMAAEYLDDSLRDLLPRAISQPALRPQLELVARCRCALAVGKPLDELDDDDMGALEASVARYLGGSWTNA